MRDGKEYTKRVSLQRQPDRIFSSDSHNAMVAGMYSYKSGSRQRHNHDLYFPSQATRIPWEIRTKPSRPHRGQVWKAIFQLLSDVTFKKRHSSALCACSRDGSLEAGALSYRSRNDIGSFLPIGTLAIPAFFPNPKNFRLDFLL